MVGGSSSGQLCNGSVQLRQVGRREVLLEQRVVDGDRGTALHAQKLRQQRAVVVFEPTAPTKPPPHSANIHGLLSPRYFTTKCDSK